MSGNHYSIFGDPRVYGSESEIEIQREGDKWTARFHRPRRVMRERTGFSTAADAEAWAKKLRSGT